MVGKLILYAQRSLVAPEVVLGDDSADLFAVPAVADIPWPGTCIKPGEPVMTIMATGENIAECRSRLTRARARVAIAPANPPATDKRRAAPIARRGEKNDDAGARFLLYMFPGLSLSIWAQITIWRARAAASRVPVRRGLLRCQAAAMLMTAAGVSGVQVEPADSEPGDHYDPRRKVLYLSE